MNNNKGNLEVSDGFLFETPDLSVPDLRGRTSYDAVRNSLRVKYKFVMADKIRIEDVNIFQLIVADIKDYILKLIYGLRLDKCF